jgi:DNA uptake protein ComE-like DNA-binding protein
MKALITISIFALAVATGCNQSPDQTREQAEHATEKAREEGKTAVAELKKDTKEAVEQTKAAAEGVKQGLHTPDKPDRPVDINSASKIRLQSLPGVDEETADRIIAGRPYPTKESLRRKHVVSAQEYAAIRSKVVVE